MGGTDETAFHQKEIGDSGTFFTAKEDKPDAFQKDSNRRIRALDHCSL
jgi:hypothetical protein